MQTTSRGTSAALHGDAASRRVTPRLRRGTSVALHGDAASRRVIKTDARRQTFRAILELEFWQFGDSVLSFETAKFSLERRCVSAQKFYRLIGISPPHRLFPARHPPHKDKNIIAKLPPFRGGSFNYAYTDKALSSLKSLEWIDGLDAAVHLPIVQVFRPKLSASVDLCRSQKKGIVELKVITSLDVNC